MRAVVSAGHGAYVSALEHSNAWTLIHGEKLPATTSLTVPQGRQHEMVDFEKTQNEVHNC